MWPPWPGGWQLPRPSGWRPPTACAWRAETSARLRSAWILWLVVACCRTYEGCRASSPSRTRDREPRLLLCVPPT
ncbi:rCG53537 [Rattus norvegicus]|uniref:RCG53537 n=1 Tax=Rattus norvegicus TaxID=10116 RepID=A6J8N9_RAT|nr:rCG53537 [Rattus norvegicus]